MKSSQRTPRRTPLATAAASVRTRVTRLVDVVPGLRRTLTELVRVEIVDRSMILGAQGLLALTPLLIVIAAVFPHDIGRELLNRFEDVTGIGTTGSAQLQHALSSPHVTAETGFVGVFLTLASATSFARAVQRIYERVWEQPHIGGLPGTRRCFLWLVGWLLLVDLLAVAVSPLHPTYGARILRLVIELVVGSLVWWWTGHMLLLGRVPWRQLLCGAALTGLGTTLVSRGAQLVMPRYTASNIAQFGTLGLVFAIATWLIVFGAVLVAVNVVGRVITEEPRLHSGIGLLARLLGARPAPPTAASEPATPEPPPLK